MEYSTPQCASKHSTISRIGGTVIRQFANPQLGLWLFSFGFVLSVSSQLRLQAIPVGPGELLLSIWALVTLSQNRAWPSQSSLGLVALVVAAAAVLSLGFFGSSYPASQTRPSPTHDSLAYLFCALLAVNYVTLRETDARLLVEKILLAFVASTVAALLLGWFLSEWTEVNVLYYGVRWQHLSNNPNQFALMALPLPFLALSHLRQHPLGLRAFLVFFTALLAMILGWKSRSDALAAAWLLGGFFVGGALLYDVKMTYGLFQWRPTGPCLSAPGRWLSTILVLTLLCGSGWYFRPTMLGVLGALAPVLMSQPPLPPGETAPRSGNDSPANSNDGVVSAVDGAQVSRRGALWRNSVAAILHEPVFGLGPGAHSGFNGPFEGEEAHNTFLDWGTQTGIVGLSLLLAYSSWIFYTVARCRNPSITGMLLAVGLFSMFHFTLRQPIFWLLPLLAIDLAAPRPNEKKT